MKRIAVALIATSMLMTAVSVGFSEPDQGGRA